MKLSSRVTTRSGSESGILPAGDGLPPLGRDAFHRVPLPGEGSRDAVERVPYRSRRRLRTEREEPRQQLIRQLARPRRNMDISRALDKLPQHAEGFLHVLERMLGQQLLPFRLGTLELARER